MIKLAIVDDHKIFRQGLINIINNFPGVEVIFEAENGAEIVDYLKDKTKEKPDIILMDIKMPIMDGVEATKKIKNSFPKTKIIILSMQDDERFILHLIKLGANGYLLKNCEPKEVEESINNVFADDYYFNNQVSKIMQKGLALKKTIITEYDINLIFTERELKVLELICKEYTTAEISKELCMSARTLDGYRRSLLKKTNTKSSAGLVIFAIKYDIFDLKL